MRKSLKLLLFLSILLLNSCGDKKIVRAIPEPPDYEPDGLIESKPFGDTVPAAQLEKYKDFITDLGGVYNDPSYYVDDYEGLEEYLEDSGIKHFTAFEIAIPGTPWAAKRCKLDDLIPPKGNWVKAVAMLLMYEDLRQFIDSPIQITSWYRPKCYNAFIGGARRSDHVSAEAMDASFKSQEHAQMAQAYLCHNYWQPEDGAMIYSWNPLNMAVGLGRTMTHLSLFSDKGRRYWPYVGYDYQEDVKECWQ